MIGGASCAFCVSDRCRVYIGLYGGALGNSVLGMLGDVELRLAAYLTNRRRGDRWDPLGETVDTIER